MKILLSWLKDYIDIPLIPADLAKQLTGSGLAVEEISPLDDADAVLDIEITSNRSDWLSYLGIAREVAALTGGTVRLPDVSPPEGTGGTGHPFSIEIRQPEFCTRYVGRLIEGIAVGSSPEWMRRRLTAMGVRSVSNAVDITNYCLYETGHPLHAFDYDRLSGGQLIVRFAEQGEEIVTIDGLCRRLDRTMLVIADAEKPVAIAGIMGGKGTEVTAQTKTILLESAWFDPVSVRRTSRKLGLSSDSSYRFERRADPENVVFSSDRAMRLFRQLIPGCRERAVTDFHSAPIQPRRIDFTFAAVEKLTGVSVSPEDIMRILQALGFSLIEKEPGRITVGIPSWRQDVAVGADLIEEIVRIRGYETVPTLLPALKPKTGTAYSGSYLIKQDIRRILTGCGLDEIITYSMVSKALLSDCRVFDEAITPRISNPLSTEQEYLRNDLAPSLLKAAAHNQAHGTNNPALFEIAKVYRQSGSAYRECEVAALALCGSTAANWRDRSRQFGFYDAKGMLEAVLDGLGIAGYSWAAAEEAFAVAGQSARVLFDGQVLGGVCSVDGAVLQRFDVTGGVYWGWLDIAVMLPLRRTTVRFQPLPKYPAITRDVALVVDKSVSGAEIELLLRKTAGDLLRSVSLFDVYEGPQIPDHKRGLAFSLEYRSDTETLTDQTVNPLQEKAVAAVCEVFGATIR